LAIADSGRSLLPLVLASNAKICWVCERLQHELTHDTICRRTAEVEGEPMDNVTLIRIVSGIMALFVFAVAIVVIVLYILTLSRALNKCSAAARTIQPGTLWLLLVPFVNLVWNFIVVLGMAKSLGNEFRARNAHQVEPEPGKSIGIAMAACAACAVIPVVGIAAGLAYLVLWILYWVKMAEFSRKLDATSATVGMPLAPGVISPQ
jgi:Domain of unknown function (DUF4328)